jgi:hypothetical protein
MSTALGCVEYRIRPRLKMRGLSFMEAETGSGKVGSIATRFAAKTGTSGGLVLKCGEYLVY